MGSDAEVMNKCLEVASVYLEVRKYNFQGHIELDGNRFVKYKTGIRTKAVIKTPYVGTEFQILNPEIYPNVLIKKDDELNGNVCEVLAKQSTPIKWDVEQGKSSTHSASTATTKSRTSVNETIPFPALLTKAASDLPIKK